MTKKISLSDEDHARLSRYRPSGERFSQTVDRLLDERAKEPLGFPDRVPRVRVSAQMRLEEIEADRDDLWGNT